MPNQLLLTTPVAQKVAELLQQAYPFQADGSNPALDDRDSGSRARIHANYYRAHH
jgi:hypothetical protein